MLSRSKLGHITPLLKTIWRLTISPWAKVSFLLLLTKSCVSNIFLPLWLHLHHLSHIRSLLQTLWSLAVPKKKCLACPLQQILDWLFFLPRALLLLISSWFPFPPPSSLYSDITFSLRFSLNFLFKIVIVLSFPLSCFILLYFTYY